MSTGEHVISTLRRPPLEIRKKHSPSQLIIHYQNNLLELA